MGIDRKTGFGTLITKALKPFFQTPAQGAETAIFLATSDEVGGVTGKYFCKKKAIKSSQSSYNKEMAERLWAMSAEMTGLK
jgi:hypothetical protein